MNGMDRKQEDADIKSVQENPGYFRDLPPERKTENVCWHAVNADSAMCVMYRKKCSPTRLSVWL